MDPKKLLIFIGSALAVLVIIIIVLMTAFGKPPTPAAVTLQFWGTFDDASFYQQAIRNYRQTHSYADITYQSVDYSDYESGLVNAFAAGTGPDIWLMHNTWLPKYGNLMAPLPQKVSSQKEPLFTVKQFQDSFVDVAQQDLMAGGQIYGLPIYVDTLALYYNKDLFNSAGITSPPRTWEDFNTDINKLTVLDAKGYITRSGAAIGTAKNINRSTDILMLLMLQSGVHMTDDQGRRASFGEQVEGLNVGETALQYYTDFSHRTRPDRYTWDDSQKYSIDAFIEGNTAIMFNYSHQIAAVRSRAPRLNFGIAPMPQPGAASQEVDFANYWAPTVSKHSKNIEEAWKFLNVLRSQEGAQSYLTASNRPPARRDLINQEKNDPDLGTFATQGLTARSWYQADNIAIESIFADMIDDVNYSRATLAAALRSAQDKVSVLMRSNSQ